LSRPRQKPLAAKFKAMNLDSVLVIADEVDENLYLASRNLVNMSSWLSRVMPIPCHWCTTARCLVTKAALGQQLQGDVRMSATVSKYKKFDEGRLMQVLVSPIVSEKATMVAEKSPTL
jgi:hypothetical protein